VRSMETIGIMSRVMHLRMGFMHLSISASQDLRTLDLWISGYLGIWMSGGHYISMSSRMQ